MLTTKQKKAVEKNLDVGRQMAGGTMGLYIAFNTAEEIEHAKAWMIGKQKVKNIEVGFPHPSIFPLQSE